MGGKSQDFGGVATAQGAENDRLVRDQTYANRPTQTTPWGYTSWDPSVTTDPATGEQVTSWEQKTGLSPELMDIFNKQVAIQGGRTDIGGMMTSRLGQNYGQQANFDNLSPMGYNPTKQFTAPEGSVGDTNQFRQQGADASYNAAMNRITPQFEEQRRAAEVKMRNQGLGPEDAAWQSQMQGIGQNENDARNQAIWGSQEAGRQEAQLSYGQQLGNNQNMFNQSLAANNQNFGQSMQGSSFANQIRQQQISEMMQERGFNLNEINAIMSGQQVGMPQMPNFSQSGASQGAPIYQGAADQASIDAANNPTNALIGAAGTAAGAYRGKGAPT